MKAEYDFSNARKNPYAKLQGVVSMRKPDGVEEFDGYPMPNVPPDRKSLSKGEEDRIDIPEESMGYLPSSAGLT